MPDEPSTETSTETSDHVEAVPSNHAAAATPVDRSQPNDPLHGITLEAILNTLVAEYGWEELGDRIRINCFVSDPSVKSSLKFLRRTPWARKKVEALYVATLRP
jgi:uncharacterized protein (DUF2132 family)